MLFVYFTLSGQTRRFVEKFDDCKNIELNIDSPYMEVDEPFILVCPTYERVVTDCAWDFLETGDNLKYCKGLVGGGNRNFDDLFCYTVKDLSVDFDLPVLLMMEFQGSQEDVDFLKRVINTIEGGGED